MEARQCAPVTVHLIAEKLGIKLKIAFLAKGISGMLEKIGDSFLITLNETAIHAGTRVRPLYVTPRSSW